MKWIATLLTLFSFSQTFAADWIPGQQTATFHLTAGRDVSRFIVLDAISGFDAAPFVLIPKTVHNDSAFKDLSANAVPQNDELRNLLSLDETQFRAGLEDLMKFHGDDYVTLRARRETPAEKAAWNVVNSNQRKNPEITISVFTEYSPVDFEISSFEGENGDHRYNCVAGYKIAFRYKVVGVSFPGDHDLTAKSQGVIGTVFDHPYPYYVARNFLPRKIDLNKEQAEAYRQECKAEKNKLRP